MAATKRGPQNDYLLTRIDAATLADAISRDSGGNPKKSGRGWLVRCPNPHHRDNNPSCSVNEKGGTALWHCFACKTGGNAITWMKLVRGCDGTTAVRELKAMLDGDADITAPSRSSQKQRTASERSDTKRGSDGSERSASTSQRSSVGSKRTRNASSVTRSTPDGSQSTPEGTDGAQSRSSRSGASQRTTGALDASDGAQSATGGSQRLTDRSDGTQSHSSAAEATDGTQNVTDGSKRSTETADNPDYLENSDNPEHPDNSDHVEDTEPDWQARLDKERKQDGSLVGQFATKKRLDPVALKKRDVHTATIRHKCVPDECAAAADDLTEKGEWLDIKVVRVPLLNLDGNLVGWQDIIPRGRNGADHYRGLRKKTAYRCRWPAAGLDTLKKISETPWVLLTEGITDWLTATQTIPGWLHVGALGAERMRQTVELIAKKANSDTRLVVIGDGDEAGVRNADVAHETWADIRPAGQPPAVRLRPPEGLDLSDMWNNSGCDKTTWQTWADDLKRRITADTTPAPIYLLDDDGKNLGAEGIIPPRRKRSHPPEWPPVSDKDQTWRILVTLTDKPPPDDLILTSATNTNTPNNVITEPTPLIEVADFSLPQKLRRQLTTTGQTVEACVKVPAGSTTCWLPHNCPTNLINTERTSNVHA